jgi:hypothetical protein
MKGMKKEVIELSYPVELSGRGLVRTIELRRAKVKDLELVDRYDTEAAKTLHLISHLAEWSPDEVRELDFADYRKVSDKVAGFLGLAP